MDKNDLERRLEAAEKQNLGLLDEIKYLKEQLAKVQDEEIPKFPVFVDGMPFWFCNDAFFVQSKTAHGSIDYPNFNLFHSEKYAQLFTDKCKLIAMMLHCKWYLDRDYVPDWENKEERKYFVCYDHVNGCFKYGLDHSFNGGSISFGTDGAARKCADWLNAHWKEDGNGTDT